MAEYCHNSCSNSLEVSAFCLHTCAKTPTPLVNGIVNDGLVNVMPNKQETMFQFINVVHPRVKSSLLNDVRGFLSYTSSLFSAINKLGRSPATNVINSPWSVGAKCIALAAGTVHSTQCSQI